MTPEDAALAADALMQMPAQAPGDSPGKATSGLVIQQRLFMRALSS